MAAVAVLSAVGSVLAYPRPAAVAPRWELEFEAGPLRLYVDPVEGNAYWCFTYKVTNRTGHDQVWAPSLTLFTDAGEIRPSGRGVPSRVAVNLRELLGNELLENQNAIIGEILHGREHAREGLVIWPAGNLEVNEVSLLRSLLARALARYLHTRKRRLMSSSAMARSRPSMQTSRRR